ncbi:hypothetical protein ABIF35_006756 [Bradyrhizobium japonicum]
MPAVRRGSNGARRSRRQRLGQQQHDDRGDDRRGNGDDDEHSAPRRQLDDEAAGRGRKHRCKSPGRAKQAGDCGELAATKAIGRDRIGNDEAGAAADALQEAQRKQQRCAGGERAGYAHRDEHRQPREQDVAATERIGGDADRHQCEAHAEHVGGNGVLHRRRIGGKIHHHLRQAGRIGIERNLAERHDAQQDRHDPALRTTGVRSKCSHG